MFLPSLKNDSWVNLDNPGLIIGKISNGTAIRKSQSTGTGYGVNGTCGDNTTWELTTSGVLTISGNGAMKDYDEPYGSNADVAPWYDYGGEYQRLL